MPCSFSGNSVEEFGREDDGVLIGVPLGVDDALSKPTRDFLDDERGVTLLFKKAFTGVTSSYTVLFALGVVAALLRTLRLVCALLAEAVEGATASRGVSGVFAVRLLASFGFRLVWGFRSMGISSSQWWCSGVCSGRAWPVGVAIGRLLGRERC